MPGASLPHGGEDSSEPALHWERQQRQEGGSALMVILFEWRKGTCSANWEGQRGDFLYQDARWRVAFGVSLSSITTRLVTSSARHFFEVRRPDDGLTAALRLALFMASSSPNRFLSLSNCLSRRSNEACVFVQTGVCGDPLRSVTWVQSH
jgi:hypothetical protein